MSTASTSLEELRQEIAEKDRVLSSKQAQLLQLYKSTKSATGERVVAPHEAEQIRTLEGQAVALTDQVNALKLDFMEMQTEHSLNRRKEEPFGSVPIHSGNGGDDALKAVTNTNMPDTLGEAFVEGHGYKAWRHGGQGQNAHVEAPALGFRHYAAKSDTAHAMKATLTTSGFTSYERPPGVVMLGQQTLTVADLLSNAQTGAPVIRYLQETTFTNAATTVAEEGLKPEQTWDLDEVDAPVRKIAVTTKVTDESFMDYPQLRDYINDRLPFAVRQREEFQLLAGDGLGQNLTGILNVSGILTEALGTHTNIDAIYYAMTKIRTQGFFEPDAVVIHPNNWAVIRLAVATGSGLYLYGPPALAGPETIFGKRVVITANITAGTGLVGAFKIGGTVHYRQGIRVEATNSDQDDFVKNRITLRAEQREALTVWRPKAFCKVTGLTAPV